MSSVKPETVSQCGGKPTVSPSTDSSRRVAMGEDNSQQEQRFIKPIFQIDEVQRAGSSEVKYTDRSPPPSSHLRQPRTRESRRPGPLNVEHLNIAASSAI